MPVSPTYPGVYIEELPSGVRTITGVATSVTAFIGRALRGPVDEPVTINSFADFERTFGGLWLGSTLGFAVRDFYLNGGSQAIIVRLFKDETEPVAAPAALGANGLSLEAVSPGAWGNSLRARIDHNVSQDVAEGMSLTVNDLFNLTVRDMKTGAEELFRNLTIADTPLRVDRVLKNESRLVRVSNPLPVTVPVAHGAGAAGKSVWEDDTASSKVEAADKVTDGAALAQNEFTGTGKQGAKQGLYALEKADIFNLLVIPPYTADGNVDATLVGIAAQYCEARRAMLLVDPPSTWTGKDAAKSGVATVGTKSKNAALFFPRLKQANPLRKNQIEEFVPSGAIAGIFARTDVQRGVWKAPAGLESTLVGISSLSVPLTDAENGELNPLGVNCIRVMPAAGPVVWGARTLQGDDRLSSEWKYIPVRRLALYLEESIYRATHWVVFEPNDEPLWAQIRLNIGSFMHSLFRQGAFQGKTPQEAYLVKCDRETTTQDDINRGIVNILVGFAPLKPAEFVIIKLQQMAGQIQA